MAKTYSSVFRDVTKKIRPSPDQRRQILSLSRKTLNLTSRLARKYKAKAMLAGSITRDTWLPDKAEFDVFVLFPAKMNNKKMEELGLKIGKSVITKLKGEVSIEYAEHPYVSGLVGGIDIDIVPCFAVESAEKIKSAVDRTPFHVRYIEKTLPLRLSNDVRLLKKFLKSNGIYGADAKAEGFSGYVCELLIIRYQNLLNLLKAVAKWEPGEIIDLQNKKPDVGRLHKDFRGQPLILIDPTDKNRNTAAALSPYSFYKFRKLAKQFLAKPRTEMFFVPSLNPITRAELEEQLTKRGTELLVVRFIPPKVIRDILWQQLRRFGGRLRSILEETKYEFRVLNTAVFTDEKFIAAVLLEMEVSQLPTIQKNEGPIIFDRKNAQAFLKKYKETVSGPYVEGQKWVVETNRKFLTARDKITDSLSAELEELKAKGVPNNIAHQLKKEFEVFSDLERIMHSVERNPEFGDFVRRFLAKESLV